jgi:DNA polymerase-1
VEETPAAPLVIAAPAAEPDPAAEAPPERLKWLIAVDVSYFVCSTFFSGAGVEAAAQFDGWLSRRLASLHKDKGLTDVVCCLDSPDSFRKRLTETWEHPYKKRVAKEDELRDQLRLAGEFLRKRNLLCVAVDGMEADDVMASYAAQFDGRITLLTKDKDLRQCLSSKCNMLTKIEWEPHPDTGKLMPAYQWVTAATHFSDGVSYNSSHVDGITPEQWPHFQALAGDPGDNVKGAIGIGPKVAVELIREHNTVHAVIAACKDGKANVTEKKRLAILDFEPQADVTLQLVTMLTNLQVPSNTTYAMIENIDVKETPES